MPRAMKTPDASHPIEVTPSDDHVVIRSGGTTIGESRATLVLQESNYPPVRYVPLADLDRSLLEESETTSYCPYKGDASYLSIRAGGEAGTDAIWFYAAPYPAVEEIKDHAAFYTDRVELVVD